jgi:hypothetical protein
LAISILVTPISDNQVWKLFVGHYMGLSHETHGWIGFWSRFPSTSGSQSQKNKKRLMLIFVEIQRSTTVDELSDVMEQGSQYNSLILVVALHHNSFPDIIIHDRIDGNSGVPVKTGTGLVVGAEIDLA